MIRRMVVLGLAGMAVGVGFKTGIFNIGVSGQMIFGGMTAGLLALNLGSKIPNGVGQFLIILIAVSMGAIVAGFAGLLKAYFKIHEVVSTILLNWIAFYFMKWMLDPNSSTILNERNDASQRIGANYLLRIDGNPTTPMLIILFTTALFLWFFIYKTRYGMMLKMTGLNPDASKFSGINTNLITFYSMALSGAVAGLLGAVIYFGMQDTFDVPKADAIPTEGFDGIAIAIISYSNPFSIIFVSLFFAMVRSGIINSAGAIDTNFIYLVLGILMYVSAVNKIFIYLNWKKVIRKLFYSKTKNKLYENYLTNKEQIDANWYDEYNLAKTIENDKKMALQQQKKVIISDYHKKLNNWKNHSKNLEIDKSALQQQKKVIISDYHIKLNNWKNHSQKIMKINKKELKKTIQKIINGHYVSLQKLKKNYTNNKLRLA